MKLTNKQKKTRGKFLSLILRHKPETIGIELDENGWVAVDELLDKLEGRLTREQLEDIVETNNKKRYEFNEDKSRIRASQGHSVKVDLGYDAVEPPEFLYHGTATRFLEAIKEEGLEKRSRHDVHLSTQLDTATDVGNRHGKVVILTIRAKEMHTAGYKFFVSTNQVWLTDHVPAEFIDFPE